MNLLLQISTHRPIESDDFFGTYIRVGRLMRRDRTQALRRWAAGSCRYRLLVGTCRCLVPRLDQFPTSPPVSSRTAGFPRSGWGQQLSPWSLPHDDQHRAANEGGFGARSIKMLDPSKEDVNSIVLERTGGLGVDGGAGDGRPSQRDSNSFRHGAARGTHPSSA